MRCLERNKRQVYICNKYQDGLITKFRSPIALNTNYQYTNSEGDLVALGLEFPMYIRIKANITDLNLFHANDRLYVMTTPTNPFDELCQDADYEVDSDPIISLNSIEVTLKRLSGK